MGDERMFPIQAQRGAAPHPTKIPWSVAELAYSVYSAEYGREQSLERLAERGGFGPGEMDMFLPDWRDRCSEVAALRKRVEELEISAGSAAMTIRLAQARAEKAEAQLQEAELRYAREFTTRVDFQERAEKAERELAETKLKWARSVGAAAATRKAFQADLDAAHACLGRILGTVRGSNLGYEIEALLEKRRESRG